MGLADLVAAVHAEFDADAAMADVAAVSGHDRYQASAGIKAAAEYVAARAEAAGLADVAVLSFPADGTRRWWTYRAPLPWTPVRASLSCDGTVLIRYPEQPYTLAANSAGTPPGGRTARCVRWSAVRDGADPAGALVIVDAPAVLAAIAGPLTSAGAVAVAADALGGLADREPGQVGRIELPAGSALSAFSLTQDQLARLAAAADRGVIAEVAVEVDDTDLGLPVVTARLPGTSDDELLLAAHLCHPRPGANDNASGVAALLGVARVLAGGRDGAGRGQGSAGSGKGSGAGSGQPDIRFVWGPEFVGVAAYLHDVVQAGRAAVPSLAVNVDMAGENVQRCGGPLVIERGPDDLPSFLPALAERCAALLPPDSRSYSGAVPCDPWTWRATPFAGGSDHALLADAPTRCPAIALGHWPDRTNHSSADTLDVVDPAELRRTAVVAGAVVAAVRGRPDPCIAADVADATVSWAAEHVLAALPGRRLPARSASPADPAHRLADGPANGPVLDPRAEASTRRWLDHRAKVAVGAVRALGLAGATEPQIQSAARWVTSIADAAAGRLTGAGDGAADHLAGPALARSWPGPANLRALAEAAPADDRAWLDAWLARDRGGSYARALALMHSLNGERDRQGMAWWAALSSELPIQADFADRFLDLLCRAGWAGVPAPGGC